MVDSFFLFISARYLKNSILGQKRRRSRHVRSEYRQKRPKMQVLQFIKPEGKVAVYLVTYCSDRVVVAGPSEAVAMGTFGIDVELAVWNSVSLEGIVVADAVFQRYRASRK